MALFPQFSLLQRLSASINELGWRDSAWLAVARLLERVPGERCALHRYQFVAQAVAPGSLCRGRGQAITVMPCQEEADLPPGPERRPGALRERYRQGAQCLVARSSHDAGRSGMAGWIWLLHEQSGEHYLAAAQNLPPFEQVKGMLAEKLEQDKVQAMQQAIIDQARIR